MCPEMQGDAINFAVQASDGSRLSENNPNTDQINLVIQFWGNELIAI